MGYTIAIGELEIEKRPEDGLDSSCIGFSVESAYHENAPAFGDPTDHTNERWPSYSAWSNSLEFAGLHDLFFSCGSLIGGHPGIRLITKELVENINSAKDTIERENSGIVAEYNSGDKNAYYCRILWLHYWVNWAFENCETPVISNY